MDVSFAREKAIGFANEACEEDRAGNYTRALNLYSQAIRYMLHVGKYEKNAMSRKLYLERATSYLERGEQLKKITATVTATGKLGSAQMSSAQISAAKKCEGKGVEEEGGRGGGKELSAADRDPINIDAELQKIVGLDSVKQQIRDWQHQLKLDLRRRELGFEIGKIELEHMAFLGNPGTGKTRVAILIAKVLRDLGLLQSDAIVECQRSDLVEGYVGQTALKTRKIIERARGGVLFVDEAYRLANSTKTQKDFGAEAINEMMAVMNDDDSPLFIFAGYPQDMKAFFAVNEGLFRRVNRRFEFADMTVDNLVELFRIVLRQSPFKLDESIGDVQLAGLLGENTTVQQRSMLNGALVQLTLQRAKAHLDRRLTISSTIEELSTYSIDDVRRALQDLPQHEELE